MDGTTLLNLAWALVSGVGAILLVPAIRYYWDRRRWHVFAGLILRWAREEPSWGDLTDEDWHALVATKLFEAGFEPRRVKELVELGVWFAKARASQELRGSFQAGEKGVDDGGPKPPK